MPDFLPRRDADLLVWSRNLSQQINADPGRFHLAPDACARYAAAQADYAAAYALATNPGTRGLLSVANKDAARRALAVLSRRLVKTLGGVDGIGPERRTELGLSPGRGGGVPIEPPGTPPFVRVTSVSGRSAAIRLDNREEITRRGRPRTAAGALIFTFVGEAPATDADQWRLHAQTTRTRVDLTFPDGVPNGACVWLCACWYSPRAGRGPMSAPTRAYLPGGPALPTSQALRRAA